MKRFLALLAGGLLVAATASISSAQVSFNQIKLGAGSNILTLTGPASGGSDTYAFPAASGASKQILTTAGGQNIDGTLTATVDNAILTGLRLAPTYADNLHSGVQHAALVLGMPGAAGNVYISDATGNYAIFAPGTLTADRTYTLPNATGTVALTSDITTALSGAISGTVGTMSKFTGSGNTIGDSKLTDDGSDLKYNGTAFGVNATTGNISATGTITGLTGITSSGTVTFSAFSTGGVLHNNGSGVVSSGAIDLASNGAGGDVSGLLGSTNGGTGVNNGTNTLTYGGNVNLGSNALTFTTGGATSLTLPASGTVATLADITGAVSGTIGKIPVFTGANALGDSKLADDGSNLTYNSLFNVSSTGVVSGATGLTSSGTIKFSGLSSLGVVHNAADGTLSTGLVALGTGGDVSGILTPGNGGTGVDNGSNTITLGGNMTTSGTTVIGSTTNNVTLQTTGNTNITLPTSGTLATTGGSVQYGGSNNTLATATTKLFDVAYTDVTTSGNLAGASITADGSASTGATNVTSTGLTVTALAKGTGDVTALSISATGGTGIKKAIDAAGSIVSNANVQGAKLLANTASGGLTLGNGASATVLSSTATSARAINFPDNAGTLALTSDITSAVSGAISGTANAIPKFATANTIGDSKLTDDGADLKYNVNKFAVNATTGNITAAGTISGLTSLTSSGTITFSAFSTAGVLHNNGSGVLSSGAINLASNGAGGDVSGLLSPTNGGTGVNNGSNTLTYGGNVNLGGNALTLTTSGPTTLTLPTSGTLATTGGTVGFNVNATQTSTTAANNLFDVTSAPATGTALGAKITATGNGAVADNATGLTIAATSGASGTATGISISTSGGATKNAINATSGNIVAATGNLVTGNASTAGHTKISNGTFFADVVTATGNLTADHTYTIPSFPNADATFAITTGGGSVIFTGPTTPHTYTLPDADGVIATSTGSVAYGASNNSLTAGATKLFNVSYGAIGASASTAGAAISSDASGGSNTDVPATGLTVSSVAKGTGNSTALSLSATGGTGTLKALDVTAGSSSFAGDVTLGANLKGYGPNKFADIASVIGTGAAQNFTINNSNVTASSLIIVTTKVSSTGNHYLPVLESVNAGNFIVNLSGVPAVGETVSLSYIVIN